jgi:hypothetical protein
MCETALSATPRRMAQSVGSIHYPDLCILKPPGVVVWASSGFCPGRNDY